VSISVNSLSISRSINFAERDSTAYLCREQEEKNTLKEIFGSLRGYSISSF